MIRIENELFDFENARHVNIVEHYRARDLYRIKFVYSDGLSLQTAPISYREALKALSFMTKINI